MFKKVFVAASTFAAAALLASACGETKTDEKSSTSKTGKGQPARTSSDAPDIEVRETHATTDESKLAEGCKDASPPYGSGSAFAFRLLQLDAAENGDASESVNNRLVSPLSIQLAVNMLANGADDDVWEPLLLSMCMQGMSVADVNDYSRDLMGDITKVVDGEPEVTIANTLLTRKDIPLAKDVKDSLQYWFGANASFFDPGDSQATADKVNDWVSDNTKKRITELVSPGDFSPLTVLVLVNALTFDADWTSPFEDTSTYPDKFATPKGDMEIDFMHGELTIPFAEHAEGEGGPSFVGGRLDYGKSERFGMHVIVPTNETTVDDVVMWFNSTRWRDWKDSVNKNSEPVKVVIPKMQIEQQMDLTGALEDLGLPLETYGMFVDSDENVPDILLSKAMHAVFMKVDEKGTEAAAATSMTMAGRGAPQENLKPKELIADRPFLLMLDDAEKETVLFAGVIRKPAAIKDSK